MFWRKRKATINSPEHTPLVKLASQLGVERRYAVRIKYPKRPNSLLPTIHFMNQSLKVHDISVGGCCLWDEAEHLGPSVGNEVHLILKWPDGSVSIHGRIVSRVDHKRHIQFLNMPTVRIENLKTTIAFGAAAQSLQCSLNAVTEGPSLVAREIWSSPHGDSVVIDNDIQRLAQIYLKGQRYTFHKQAPPVKNDSQSLSRDDIEQVIVFLCNIPQPSALIEALVDYVESLADKGEL